MRKVSGENMPRASSAFSGPASWLGAYASMALAMESKVWNTSPKRFWSSRSRVERSSGWVTRGRSPRRRASWRASVITSTKRSLQRSADMASWPASAFLVTGSSASTLATCRAARSAAASVSIAIAAASARSAFSSLAAFRAAASTSSASAQNASRSAASPSAKTLMAS